MKNIPCGNLREGEICTCFPMECDDVDTYTCLALRCAFNYGFNTAESIANEKFEEIKAKLDEVFKNHGLDGEQG